MSSAERWAANLVRLSGQSHLAAHLHARTAPTNWGQTPDPGRSYADLGIEYALINRLMLGIAELLDTTACGLARERPLLHGDIYRLRTQCTRQVKECILTERLLEHRSAIQLLAVGLRNHAEPALARLGDLCERILAEPDVARGRNCTWWLGDLVIALEMPAHAPLYTTNRRHFEPLCQLLGKQLYDPPV